jgi:hypothetical protein
MKPESHMVCSLCGEDARGWYRCPRCGLVACLKCLNGDSPDLITAETVIPHHPRRYPCPGCAAPLRPRPGCFYCGHRPLHMLGLGPRLEWRCATCKLEFCSACGDRLSARLGPLGLMQERACPSCGGVVRRVSR